MAQDFMRLAVTFMGRVSMKALLWTGNVYNSYLKINIKSGGLPVILEFTEDRL